MKRLFLLLLLVGCTSQPIPTTPTEPPTTPPPVVVPTPTPAPTPTPNPNPQPEPMQYGTLTLTARMWPQWYPYKMSWEAYRLEWFQNGWWRTALVYDPVLGEGWAGRMTEAQPSITLRLPVGRYRITYGNAPCTYAYHHNQPWREEFELTTAAPVSLTSTRRWESGC